MPGQEIEMTMRRQGGRVFTDFTELASGETFFVEVPLAEIPPSLRELVPPAGMLCPVGLPQEDPGVCQTTQGGMIRVFVELSQEDLRLARSRGITLDHSRAGWVPPKSWPEELRRKAAVIALLRAAEMGLW